MHRALWWASGGGSYDRGTPVGFGVWSFFFVCLGFWVWGLGFRVHGLGLGVLGSGFRVQGLGLKV
jgi:hypothetical protein